MSHYQGYVDFKAKCPRLKVVDPRTEYIWEYHQMGNAQATEALIFIHGVCGTAGVFFHQVEHLASKGYRVLSVQYPCFSKVSDWCKGFDRFLDQVNIVKVHLCGSQLGGFLIQNFASAYANRVLSMILINSFTDTAYWADESPCLHMMPLMPHFVLKKFVVDSFPEYYQSMDVKQACDFMAGQLDDISTSDLCARLTLNCTEHRIGDIKLPHEKVMIIEPQDDTTLPKAIREAQKDQYPDCRVSQLKDGGDFPFLVRAAETSLHIEVFMRQMGRWGNTEKPRSSDASSVLVEAEREEQIKKERQAWVNPFD